MTPDVFAWHRAMLAGEKPPTYSTPECGWFLYKGHYGMVPASIYWESPLIDTATGEILADQELRCEVGGAQADPWETWLFLAKRPISREEYERRLTELVTGVSEELPF